MKYFIPKRYLGDGVYVYFDGYHVVLTTEDGVSIQNTIFMEGQVVKQFNDYMADLGESLMEKTST